jgi:hypothetical protein
MQKFLWTTPKYKSSVPSTLHSINLVFWDVALCTQGHVRQEPMVQTSSHHILEDCDL